MRGDNTSGPLCKQGGRVDYMQSGESADLGFTWRSSKSGEVMIHHRGRLAGTLRGADAIAFQQEMQGARPVRSR